MMYLKCDKETAAEIKTEEKIMKMFLYSKRYGENIYFSFLSNVQINLINVLLQDILFNTESEIIYIDEEEAYRMGIML